jgi:hypothetical protein
LPDGYFSAYPRLACGQKGLLNPMALTWTNFVPALLSAGVRSCLAKYYNWGFDIRQNPGYWLGDTHKCTFSLNCPITMWNVIDTGCMFVNLRRIGI